MIKNFGNHFIFSRMVTSTKISAQMEVESVRWHAEQN